MGEVIRQYDRQYKIWLDIMRKRDLDDDTIDYILSHSLENMNNKEKEIFESTALYIMPTWEMTRKCTLQYLRSCDGPFAIIKPIYNNSSRPMINLCIIELLYPKISALCVGEVVMLLQNYIVEEKLMNGSVGTVKEIFYDNPMGPYNSGRLTLYVVVDVSESTLDSSLIPGSPST